MENAVEIFTDSLIQDRDSQQEMVVKLENIVTNFLQPLIKKYGKKDGRLYRIVLSKKEAGGCGRLLLNESPDGNDWFLEVKE